MLIKDVLLRDAATHPLINDGQARIVEPSTEKTLNELRGELSTFVCEGQFAHGIYTIINSFLTNQGRTHQRAAWVSGFYGSGKSHLLKMLTHIWMNTKFPDGATARSLIPAMPDDLQNLLRELDTADKRSGGLLAAAGALPRGTTDNVRLTILSVILRAVGLPSGYPQARFCMWLKSVGYFDAVKQEIEAAGKQFDAALNNLYVGAIPRALVECYPNFATNEAAAREIIRSQFPSRTTDITTDEFLTSAKEALRLFGRDGKMPCTILVLDEVQYYIAESRERAVWVTEVAEAVSKELDSNVMVIGAGQNALTDAPSLQKLLDRFTIPLPLSDAEVETVTRKVLLQKQPGAVPGVRQMLAKYAGEVSRQLEGTRIGESSEDESIIVEDYPLLPVRRRFWEHCFRQIDAAGTHSQLRSQLRIIHDAVAKLSKLELGVIVPADELFDQLAPEMVTTGVLLREINERILSLGKDGTKEGKLAQRICGLTFLIGKLKRDAGVDIGVRATKEHIADLLIDDLRADNGKFRADVESILAKLVQDGALMQVGDEFRLQTREGAEWDREFRVQQSKFNADEGIIQFKRDQLLYAETDKIIRSINIIHGLAKVPRQFAVFRDQSTPQTDGTTIPVWIRDGWSCAEKDMVDAAGSAGPDSPVIFAFIPKQSAQHLRQLIVETEAAQQTISIKGNPSSDEAREAKQSMDSRFSKAVAERDRLVREIVDNTKVFQGGGSEVIRVALDERIRDAANDSLVRLFPRFKEADSNVWDSVIKRARDGADQPFQPTGHTDATEKHPVCQQVITTIAAGKTGTEIRKALKGDGFGWPQDAVDAALIALHRIEHISATMNGTQINPGQLDQNKIAKADFRVEQATLSVPDRLLLRRLFTQAGITCKPGEESVKATEFLRKLLEIARGAGGPSPLPEPPSTVLVEDLQKFIGKEQLLAIKEKEQELALSIKNWSELQTRCEQRLPIWTQVEAMARFAGGIQTADELLKHVDALRQQRSLLDVADPLSAIRIGLADILRSQLNQLYEEHQNSYSNAIAALNTEQMWQQIPTTDQQSILQSLGLSPPLPPNVSSDQALLDELQNQNFAARQTQIDAIPGRIKQAIERAAKFLEPQVRTISLERTTLRSKEDVDSWVKRQREKLIEEIAIGPVLLS